MPRFIMLRLNDDTGSVAVNVDCVASIEERPGTRLTQSVLTLRNGVRYFVAKAPGEVLQLLSPQED